MVHWGVILFLNTKSAGKPIMSPTQRRQTAQDLRLIRDSVKHKKLKAEGLIYFPSGQFDLPTGSSRQSILGDPIGWKTFESQIFHLSTKHLI